MMMLVVAHGPQPAPLLEPSMRIGRTARSRDPLPGPRLR